MPVIKGLECEKVILNGMVFWEPKFKKRRNRLPKPKNNMKLREYARPGNCVTYTPEALKQQMASEDAKCAYINKLYHEDQEAYYRLFD